MKCALVIAEQPADGVDVVGNVLEQAVLERAGVREAGTWPARRGRDSAGIFATAVVRDFAPKVRLIARVNHAANVPRMYQAGADFALSVGQVAGHLLASSPAGRRHHDGRAGPALHAHGRRGPLRPSPVASRGT